MKLKKHILSVLVPMVISTGLLGYEKSVTSDHGHFFDMKMKGDYLALIYDEVPLDNNCNEVEAEYYGGVKLYKISDGSTVNFQIWADDIALSSNYLALVSRGRELKYIDLNDSSVHSVPQATPYIITKISIDDATIVWSGKETFDEDYELYKFTIGSDTAPVQLTDNSVDDTWPSMDSGKLVWNQNGTVVAQYENIDHESTLYTLSDPSMGTVFSDIHVSGKFAVFTAATAPNRKVYKAFLSIFEPTSILIDQPGEQYYPDLSGNTMVWQQFDDSQIKIWNQCVFGVAIATKSVSTRLGLNCLDSPNEAVLVSSNDIYSWGNVVVDQGRIAWVENGQGCGQVVRLYSETTKAQRASFTNIVNYMLLQ